MATTGAIFKSLKFGDVDSADYGIYISGEAVYNAPERAVEMVNVPGRNGAIIVDQGRWENIEVAYPAGTFAENQSEFALAIAAFRNAIVSKTGYQRLTDGYHPEEYRLATYISGLEVSPVNSGVAGEFEIRFNAKPQRWLVSGEEDVVVTSGASVPNPTLYEASPLIEAEGYGTITIGDYEVEIENAVMGEVTVATATSLAGRTSYTVQFASELFNNGDTITVAESRPYITFSRKDSTVSLDSVTGVSGGSVVLSGASGRMYMYVSLPEMTITAGTDTSDSNTCSCTLTYTHSGTTSTATVSATVTRTYSSSTHTLNYRFSAQSFPGTYVKSSATIETGKAAADSTVSILGTPTYLDCDLGVCYKIENDEVVDLNAYIDLGSDLPVLNTDSNVVTYDNTITSLVIVPRWWQL